MMPCHCTYTLLINCRDCCGDYSCLCRCFLLLHPAKQSGFRVAAPVGIMNTNQTPHLKLFWTALQFISELVFKYCIEASSPSHGQALRLAIRAYSSSHGPAVRLTHCMNRPKISHKGCHLIKWAYPKTSSDLRSAIHRTPHAEHVRSLEYILVSLP
jgi:hypothetical protein